MLDVNNKLIELGFDVAEHTNALLAYWDKNLICRFANNAYMDWFGINPEEMIDKITIADLLGPLYENNSPYIKRVLDSKVQVFERDITIPSWQIRKSIATYCPHFENGEVLGFYVHVADISPLKTINSDVPINDPDEVAHYLASALKPIKDVEISLKSSLLTGFPGIANLSKRHFISESKLKRDFKGEYNTTVFSYYRSLQMELADSYISQRKCSKKQMAAMLNFSNPSNFTTCYQKYLKEKTTKKIIEEIRKESDERYKTFITQAPFAIAMFDTGLRYLAVSQKWIDDYGLKNKALIGMLHYEVFPELAIKWKNIYDDCLNGNINKGEEAFFELKGGSSFWLKWDIRPWYNAKKEIGGLLMFTEDITAFKIKEEENRKILEIFNKTSEISRIGAWKRNFKNGTGMWDKTTKEILEVPEDFNPDFSTGLTFYKPGPSRNLVEKVVNEALEKGRPFDVEVEMITAKRNAKTIRVIGYPEFINGKCERLFGLFLDITHHKSTTITDDNVNR